MKKIKIDKYLLLCILFTIIGFLILFSIYGIYPVGSNQMSLIDFDGGYIPVYYKLWDVLHLTSSAFWDWNLGAGLNSFGSLISNGLISPLCWIIAIFPRSSIPHTISYVYLLKMAFTSVISYIAIKKIIPDVKDKHRVLFALMYTFSSWTYMMSTNLLYLDAVAIFPLLVYSLKELLEKGHWKLYTLLLTLTLLSSYYIAWLDLLFIVGATGFFLITMDTDHKREKAVKVLVCTLFALLFSCILFLPGFMFAKVSTRMANNTSSPHIFDYFMDKSVYLFTLTIPLVLTIKQLFVKKDKKINKFIICMLFFMLLGVFIEPINALWHTGSHQGFPLRYAYQPTFFMIIVSLYYLTKNHQYTKNKSTSNIIIPIIVMLSVFTIFIIWAIDLWDKYQFAYEVKSVSAYLKLLLFFIGITISYLFIIKNREKTFYILTIASFLITTCIYAFLYEKFITVFDSTYTQEISSSFNLVNDGYNYMAEIDNININYPYILKVPSIANRIHFIRQEFLDEVLYLGYGNCNTIIESKGGNMFNNLLLQNKYYLTENTMDEKYYSLLEEHNNIRYYQAKYNLNYILPYNGKIYNEKNDDIFINSNNIYKELFNGKDDIYLKVDYKYDNNELSFDIEKDKRYELKIVSDKNEDLFNNSIIITQKYQNDDYIKISFIGNDNGNIRLKTNGNITNIYLYEFNENEFINFVNNNQNDVKLLTDDTKRTYIFNSEKDMNILIPINYDDNYIIKVNDETVDYTSNLYNMLAIKVKQGSNKIEISYNNKWFKYGIIITLGSLIIFGILFVLNKKYRLINKKIIMWPLFTIAVLAFIFLILKIYILTLL